MGEPGDVGLDRCAVRRDQPAGDGPGARDRHLLAELGGSSGTAPDPDLWRPWRSYALMHLWNTLMPDTPAPKEN
jgi:hypothetical protein